MREKLLPILNKIKEYNKIILFRHFRPDGDAVGSTKGLAAIIKATYPEKTVLLQNADFSDFLEFLGPEDEPISDEEYADALGIVIDTATTKRISNQKYSLCREIIKIDHHIPVESYGALEWVEELRSSSSEMIAAFYDTFSDELTLTKEAATYIYCGMVTDSGRFRFRDVSGETMRLAGVILGAGVDTDTLFAHLYLKDFNDYKFESYARRKMKITENGVVSLFVTKRMQKKWNLSKEAASASVSYMDSIKDSLIWIAFIEGDNGEIRVRLRSRFVTVSELAEKYHGGGHACAAGATVYSKNQMNKLLSEADALLCKYKSENEGWL
ncbi:MAG: bifunctional oligoribonuclease/PAP phosphatase NrnA [Clostridia bacterium]|nr:bifunctional oligoribonuclease/PAP phosphatase NrnA [Clostridia bacterium]